MYLTKCLINKIVEAEERIKSMRELEVSWFLLQHNHHGVLITPHFWFKYLKERHTKFKLAIALVNVNKSYILVPLVSLAL